MWQEAPKSDEGRLDHRAVNKTMKRIIKRGERLGWEAKYRLEISRLRDALEEIAQLEYPHLDDGTAQRIARHHLRK